MAVTHQRDSQRAGGGGELQDAVIDVAGEDRDGNEHGGRVKSIHLTHRIDRGCGVFGVA